MGELLLAMEKAKGGDFGGRIGKDSRAQRPSNEKPKTLSQMGITKDRSSRAQLVCTTLQS